MSELDGLQMRVAATAERLAVAQTERRERNRSLFDTLSRLEDKFAAQQQEIAYYRDRVRPLETANEQLRTLMGRLLDMVDAGLVQADDSDDPVQAAIALAAQVLDGGVTPGETADSARAQRFEDVTAAELAAEAESEARFEDVDADTLAAEAANDAFADMPGSGAVEGDAEMDDLAREIRMCAAEAESAEGISETPSASAGEEPAGPSAEDIQALLQRVEAAAARMAGAAGTAASQTTAADRPARRLAGAA